MLAITVLGRVEPILVARVSCDKRNGLIAVDENGRRVNLEPKTITDVKTFKEVVDFH